MKQLTEQQITSNWDKLRGIINDTFSGERLEKLNKMYDYFEDRMVVAPASGRAHFHNAMVGGYVEHILHIVKFSQELRDIWEKNGATINFTNEELVFAALHHDLGKIGDLENDYYIPEESDWHRKNQGKIYTPNPKLQYMNVSDRSLWLLQKFDIKLNGRLEINFQPADFVNLVSMQQGIVHTEKGDSLDWLSWLLKEGAKPIIIGYQYQAQAGGRSRGGIMEKGTSWRIPPQFAGTETDNFITRAFSDREKEIQDLFAKLLGA